MKNTFQYANTEVTINFIQRNRKHSFNDVKEWLLGCHFPAGEMQGESPDKILSEHLDVELAIPEVQPSTKLTIFKLSI